MGAAKGNTLLNYAGIKKDLISFVCDSSKSKQNKFYQALRYQFFIQIIYKKKKPDYLLILPWNIADEIKKQLSYLKNTKTKLFVAIPKLKIL